jgi:hypothetical protein
LIGMMALLDTFQLVGIVPGEAPDVNPAPRRTLTLGTR